MGCLILFISIRTLKITDFFRKWNNGISQRDRVIAYYAMVMGFGVCLGLFFATPITRLFTDTIGGGRRN